jgi:hypothetical protein
VCGLLPQFSYDAETPYVKVNLGRTPHKISYHYESAKHIMATSKAIPFHLSQSKYLSAIAAGVLDPDDEESKVKDGPLEVGGLYPSVGAYEIELVSSATLETVDM